MAERERLICSSGALENSGAGLRFEVKRGEATLSAFAVRFDGQVHAYLNRCTHVATELDWTPGRFFDGDGRHLVCSTHGAFYSPHSGACLGGPCTGALVRLDVEERDGCVYLKTRSELPGRRLAQG